MLSVVTLRNYLYPTTLQVQTVLSLLAFLLHVISRNCKIIPIPQTCRYKQCKVCLIYIEYHAARDPEAMNDSGQEMIPDRE